MLIHLSSAGDGLVSDFGQILGKYDNVDNRCGDEMGLNGLWLLRLLWLAEMWRSQLLKQIPSQRPSLPCSGFSSSPFPS